MGAIYDKRLAPEPVYSGRTARLFGNPCAAVLPHITDGVIDVVWTDPPYGLPMTHKGKFGFHLNDDFKTTDAGAVLRSALEECARVMTEHGEIFCMTAGPAFADTYQTLEKLGFGTIRTLTWDKGSASPTFPGFAWKNTSELIVYATRKIDRNWKTGGGTNSVIRVNRCAGQERLKDDEGKSVHPTQKPLALIEACLNNARPGIVLDPFVGVGSTLVAARRLGRNSIGIEMDETFYTVAKERLEEENNG